jgi:hypothetical protein
VREEAINNTFEEEEEEEEEEKKEGNGEKWLFAALT